MISRIWERWLLIVSVILLRRRRRRRIQKVRAIRAWRTGAMMRRSLDDFPESYERCTIDAEYESGSSFGRDDLVSCGIIDTCSINAPRAFTSVARSYTRFQRSGPSVGLFMIQLSCVLASLPTVLSSMINPLKYQKAPFWNTSTYSLIKSKS